MWIDIDIDELIKEKKKNYEVETIFSDRDIIYYVRYNFDPEQVFSEKELTQWALANGFIKEGE